MLSIKSNIQGRPEVLTIEQVRARQLLSVGSAQEAVEGMHRIIATSVSRTREGRVDNHNKKTHVRPCNADVGDYVLRGLIQTKKLSLRWRGPYRISRVLSDFLFEVKDLRTSEKATVHGTRLRFF